MGGPEMNIDIRGVEPLMTKLENLRGLKWVRGVMTAALSDLKDWIAEYPPSSEANIPYQRRWYQRGYGTRWMRKNGTIGGSKTSEQLGQRWTYRLDSNGRGGVVGNNASYAKWVQGPEQSSWHAERGWRTTPQAVAEQGPRIVDKLRTEISRLLRK